MRYLRRKIFLLSVGVLALGCSRSSPPPGSTGTPARPAARASGTPRLPSPKVRPFPRELIQAALKKWTTGFAGTSAVVCAPLRNMEEGGPRGRRSPPWNIEEGVAHRPDEVFEAASLVKLPLLVEVARRLESGELDDEKLLTFEESYRVGGSGVLKDRPAGGNYSPGQLAEWMICESDNVATDMLLDALGMESLRGSFAAQGLKSTSAERKIFDFAAIDQGRDNRISAGDAALLLARIGREELPRSAWMKEVLGKTRRRDLIQAEWPADIRVEHKTGELTGVLHDAALVEIDPPFVLVILTQQAEKPEAERFIRGLSRELLGILRL